MTKPDPAWSDVLAAFGDGTAAVYADPRVAQDPVLRAESPRYLARLFGAGALTAVELADPDYPQLARLYQTHSSWGMNNPDCVFLYAAIRDDATYRIHGTRGTVRLLDIQTLDGHITQLPNYRPHVTVSEFDVGADGTLEIVLSASRHEGNWIQLEPGVEWILVRQYSYDWEGEEPAGLAIERLGASYPPPSPSSEIVGRRLERLAAWLRHGPVALQQMADAFTTGPDGEVPFVPDPVGMAGVFYGKGHFTCRSGEAVILEVDPPPCHYWSFQLVNHRWESLDWHLRQTSLNGHQAHLDTDGVFRAVIAHTDPGVPNWLDPAGHTDGLIGGRWVRAESNPSATLRTVPLADLREHLPADTPTVTAEQRRDALRRRMLGAQRRFRE